MTAHIDIPEYFYPAGAPFASGVLIRPSRRRASKPSVGCEFRFAASDGMETVFTPPRPLSRPARSEPGSFAAAARWLRHAAPSLLWRVWNGSL